MEDEDKETLSQLYKFLPQRTPLLGGRSARHRQLSISPAPKRLRSKSCHTLEGNEGVRRRSSLCRTFVEGDFVWAKASRSSWWPGQIEGFKGRLVAVSFFGCDRTRSFHRSDIRVFEESFSQLVNEFARFNVMGLKCFCGPSSGSKTGSLAVKSGFNPLEIFGFVIDKAVSPQFADEEIATVVRLSANIIAFRSTLSICKTSKVDERFSAEALLNFVVDIAINPCTDDKKIDHFGKAAAQLSAFRRFSSMKPDGFYQQSWEFMNDSLNSYDVGENEMYREMSSKPVVDVSVKPEEEFELLEVNRKHEDRELCVSNMMDIHFFDMDEKNDQEQSEDILYSRTNDAPIKPEVGAEVQDIFVLPVQCSNGIPHMAPLEETALRIPANASGNSAVILHSRVEDTSVNPEVGAEVQHISTLQCNGNTFQWFNEIPHIAPLEKTALRIPVNDLRKSSRESPEKPEVGAEVRHNSVLPCTNNTVQCSNEIPQIVPLEKNALQIPAKRKLSESSTVIYDLPHSTTPFSKTISPSASLMDEDNPAQVKNGNDQDLSPILSCKLDNSGLFSKHFTNRSHHNHSLESKWQVFYASPLIKDGLHSANNRLRSSESSGYSTSNKYPKDRNKCITPKKKLTMKFPRDYTLPSKEDLEKKFRVFGPLDHRKTNVFFYTGVGQVVFLHQADAVVAYNYATKKAVFGQANMRFWLMKTENTKKESGNVPVAVHSSLHTKSCLKKPSTPQLDDKRRNYHVKFSAN